MRVSAVVSVMCKLIKTAPGRNNARAVKAAFSFAPAPAAAFFLTLLLICCAAARPSDHAPPDETGPAEIPEKPSEEPHFTPKTSSLTGNSSRLF